MPTTTNRLATERSPYLRNALHQPVQWFPWSPEAFQEAQRLDRPILLDIGAAWCHWCHVIDRESYENEEIAKIINEHFVAIKVDRDERPDIDSRYQRAVSALTGQGGWPLTAFLTPRGEAFFGGTYFPPEDRYGQPGFKRLLKRVAELYSTQKQDVLDDARKVAALFEPQKGPAASEEVLTSDVVQNCLLHLKNQFDFAHGGFGNAPKFFHSNALEFALEQYFFSRESWLRAVIEKTLDAMGKGGIYDQLGGGFHRYSVDERWVVPHFEKMAYDNATLLTVYAKAFALLEKPFYKEIAEGIIRWAQELFSDPERGGFYASQDADINLHDDGDYYTWTQREAESLVTKEEAQALLPHFNIEAQGEMHHDPARNVLFVSQEPEFLARQLELKPQAVLERLESAKRKLLEARRKRKAPFVDQTLYTNWNGMWIRAYLTAYRALRRPELKEFALKTLHRFKEKGFQADKGMTRFLSDDKTFREGLLEDQVEILAASLEAFEVTGDPQELDFAKKLAELVPLRFAAEDGGFFDIPAAKEEGHLRARERRIQDSPTASPNATAALAFLKLYHFTNREEYRKRAESLLRFFQSEAKGMGYFASGYVTALNFYLREPVKVVVVGKREEPLFRRLHETALFTFRPYVSLLPITEGGWQDSPDPALELLGEEQKRSGQALALVCRGKSCQPFTRFPDELSRQILGGPPS